MRFLFSIILYLNVFFVILLRRIVGNHYLCPVIDEGI